MAPPNHADVEACNVIEDVLGAYNLKSDSRSADLQLTAPSLMDSEDSHSATLSPAPEAARSPLETPLPSLKRKTVASSKRKTMSTCSPYKRTSTVDSSESNDKTDVGFAETLLPTAKAIAPAFTPPATPARPLKSLQTLAPSPIATSASVLLLDDAKNPFNVNRFKGITPTLVAIDRRPLKLRFPGVNSGELFVMTGLLQSHDMTIIKEGTDLKDQLQSKSTLTLFFVDTETFATCVGDQLRAIDAWIRTQPGFQVASDRVFRSPYDEFACTVDLTWPQYERISASSNRSARERRDGLQMRKKERLDPRNYENDDELLSWDNVEVNSVLRAQVNMTAYKDDRTRAYAGWTLNVVSVLKMSGPVGDLKGNSSALSSQTDTLDSESSNPNLLRF